MDNLCIWRRGLYREKPCQYQPGEHNGIAGPGSGVKSAVCTNLLFSDIAISSVQTKDERTPEEKGKWLDYIKILTYSPCLSDQIIRDWGIIDAGPQHQNRHHLEWLRHALIEDLDSISMRGTHEVDYRD